MGISKAEMLKKIREDRPTQVINQVIRVVKNKHGFYDVKVDMEGMMFETKIKHLKLILPYPYKSFNALSEKEQEDWKWNNI